MAAAFGPSPALLAPLPDFEVRGHGPHSPPCSCPLPEFEVRGCGRRCPSPRPLAPKADVRPPSLLFASRCSLDNWGDVSASSHSPSCIQPCDRIHITKKRKRGTILLDKGVATHAHNKLGEMGDRKRWRALKSTASTIFVSFVFHLPFLKMHAVNMPLHITGYVTTSELYN